MNTTKKFRFAVAPLLLAGLTTAIVGSGCGDELTEGPLGDLAKQCGLACPEKGILEGNASISGLANIDAFFGAVVDFNGAAKTVNANIRGQLDAMALSLGLQAGASAADIKAKIQGQIDANASGGLTVKAQPAKCQASLEVTANAAASCDATVDPGSVEVRCEGSCTVDATAAASCTGESKLTCRGQAPGLACSGTCTGNCTLEAAAACEGTCRGSCKGPGGAPGKCSVTDASGNCAGTCEGTCQGTCELSAGGSCSGKCEGTCEFTPPNAECTGGLEARCEAKADANIQCKGGCEGTATPPKVSAECKAAVEAKADASVECTPPSVDIGFQYTGDVDAQAQFNAWLNNFKVQYSGMLASLAKAELLISTAAELGASAKGAVTKAAEAAVDGNVKAKIGAGCALTQLEDVEKAVTASTTGLTASVTAVAEISSVFTTK